MIFVIHAPSRMPARVHTSIKTKQANVRFIRAVVGINRMGLGGRRRWTVRPIDADKIEYYDDYYGFEIAYKVDIDNLPTLTPPNEWVSVEEKETLEGME